MLILSHRGYWQQAAEKNSRIAFERSFSLGFGTETDLRDRHGKLVISHDMAGEDAMPADVFFALYQSFRQPLPLALNIKADGLQQELKELLNRYKIESYFVFDMAVPDGLQYIKQGLTTFTRQSEYETVPSYYESANGVWLDEFDGHWITDTVIERHLAAGKAICVVSPELHHREHHVAWSHYRDMEAKLGRDRIMLCTDYPEQAREFFNEKN